jgi:Na+-transporting NADH:ubiquinone oxidoreductase subunit A
MVHIKVAKGLNIPIAGQPATDNVFSLPLGQYAYDLRPYERLHLRIIVEEGQEVAKGQALAIEPAPPGRVFVAPLPSKVVAIHRGAKRHPLEIVLDPLPSSGLVEPDPHPNLLEGDRAETVSQLLKAGLLPCIRFRPFNRIANPGFLPKSIFVKAVETAPLVPAAEMQIQGRELQFQTGIKVLQRLTDGKVHVVAAAHSPIEALCEALPCSVHTVEGPHPASNPSLHIQHIDPILSSKDLIWTATALDVIRIGQYCISGELWVDQIVSIAGPGIKEGSSCYARTFPGIPISSLIGNMLIEQPVRLISGDPLTGSEVSKSDFLRHGHTTLSALPEASKTENKLLYFMRLQTDSYTSTNTYITNREKRYSLTTNQHGEVRPFIDGAVYDKVMPFNVLPTLMAKALLVDDLDKAVAYGFLDIVPEDFALADFICPSKISLMQIVKEGQEKSFKELFR